MAEDAKRPLHESEIAVNIAKAADANAEAQKHEAERLLFEAQARRANEEAEVAAIVRRTKEREEKAELAKDTHHHVYVFDKSVSEGSVKECVNVLTRWSRQDPQCDIELQINSPGGSIFDGLALVDFLRDLEAKGHNITTLAFGMAASMGGVLLQVGTKRVMGANAMLLIHEGSLGAIGDFGQVEDRINLMKLFHDRILDLFVDRAQPINKSTTKAFIKKNWARKDWWIPSHEALKLGFVDEVR
jgi:ATP-dependent Clp endopeptidase proteolytic subunit ClpP